MTSLAPVAPSVSLVDGHAVTTSQNIAAVFGKQHDKVLRDIRSLNCSPEFNAANFGAVEYTDAKGETRPAFTLTRDGCAFLIMGFTGKRAAQFKESYIAAFNAMEAELKAQFAPTAYTGLTDDQQADLIRALRQYTSGWAFDDGSRAWVYNHLRVAFGVPHYRNIRSEQFTAAMHLIESKREACAQFLRFLADAKSWFDAEVLGFGTPWTPGIQKQLTAQMKQRVQIPARVDWLALADQAKGKKA